MYVCMYVCMYTFRLIFQVENTEVDSGLEDKIESNIDAYNQLPVICTLVFGFAAQNPSPCEQCENKYIQGFIIILVSLTMVCMYVCMHISRDLRMCMYVCMYVCYILVQFSPMKKTFLRSRP